MVELKKTYKKPKVDIINSELSTMIASSGRCGESWTLGNNPPDATSIEELENNSGSCECP